MRRPVRILFPLVLASLVVLGIASTQVTRDAKAAAAGLHHPTAHCDASGANVTLKWSPVDGASEQWIEYSLHDNGFESDFGTIALAPGQNSLQLRAPNAELPNFWRVMSSTGEGVVASETGAFTPCGGPVLLWGPLECLDFDTASVHFRWAPLATSNGHQYLEIANDGDFAGNVLYTTDPLASDRQELRRTFESGATYHFRIVRELDDGTRLVSQAGWFTPECMPYVNPDIYGSDDRLILPTIGVTAPVNVRDVGREGGLGDPYGGHDVVRYDFGLFPNLDGTPGGPGPSLIGGHLDYYVIGPAIFWDLEQLQPGDVVEYWDGDIKYTYVVDWVTSIPATESLNGYVASAEGDTLLLITCNGEFDRDLYGGYNERTLVSASRLQ